MPWAIVDTSIYIDHWERGLYDEALSTVRRTFVVRQSSVVLSELRRGARTPEARRLVDALFKLARVQWAPIDADLVAGRPGRATVGDAQKWDLHKRRAFQNDVLIALTARRYGATVVTANRNDFDLLHGELGVAVLPV